MVHHLLNQAHVCAVVQEMMRSAFWCDTHTLANLSGIVLASWQDISQCI
jgi:hypothetical protein